jgi:GDP-L-fucose synthase
MMQAKRAGDREFVVWGTGKPVREWAYISDFVEALVQGMCLDNVVYPLNIGQEKGYSIAESAMMIKEEMGYDGEIIFDPSFPDGDPVKILGNDNFKHHFPEFKFFNHREGIAEAIKFYEINLS